MFKWPLKIDVGIHEYAIEYPNRVAMDKIHKKPGSGLFHPGHGKIYVCTEMRKKLGSPVVPPRRAFQTLCHEFVHAVSSEYALGLDETKTEVLANEIVKFFESCGNKIPPIGKK